MSFFCKRDIVKLIKKLFLQLKGKGFFSIFGATFLVKCVSFCSILFLPKIIGSTDDYGILSIVDNFNSYLILINGLGLANSILRFCSLKESYAEKRAVFEFCLKVGIIINGLIMTVSFLILSSFNFGMGSLNGYLILGLGIPFCNYIFDCATLFLRADMKNKEYARLSLIYASLYAGIQIAFAYGFKIIGVMIGRYIALIISILVGYILIFKKTEYLSVSKARLSGKEKKALFLFAVGGLCANSFSIIMPMNEQMMVTALLANETQVAYYKAASIGPSNIQFIANSIIIFAYPHFAKHSNDYDWLKKFTLVLVGALALIITPISLGMFMFAPWLIHIIFGADYLPAVGLMRVMCVAFCINSIIRISLGNVLGAIGEIKANLIIAALTALIHLILDYFFILNYGIDGAAWALTIAYLFSGIANIVHFIFFIRKKG